MSVITLLENETELRGGIEDDLLIFAEGVTIVYGGPGFDILDLSGLAFPVMVDLMAETILAFGNVGGIDVFDVEGVIGTDFNDELYGNDEDNFFFGGGGDDIIDGRGGNNTASYLGAVLSPTAEVSGSNDADGGAVNASTVVNNVGHANDINLVTGIAAGPGIGTDTLINIQNVIGSDDGDHIIGNAENNIIFGSAGDDHLEGGDGDDILDGGFDDPARASEVTGNDLIEGGAGNDRIIYSRNDTGFTDVDTVDGGTGIDTFVMSTITFTDRSIDLTAGVYTFGELDSGGPTRGFISNVENVEVIGGVQVRGDDGDNHISASGVAGDNVFEGMGGNDTLLSGDGNDDVDGGAGMDHIEGGNGNDLLRGGDDADTIFGQADNDTIFGDLGDDVLWGGDGDDDIFGGTGPAGMLDLAGLGLGTGSIIRPPAAGNSSIGTAIDVSNDFSLDDDPDVFFPTEWPHVSISAVADGGDTHFYSFTITADAGIVFDVDYAAGGAGFFDAWLNLYDGAGTLIFQGDDSNTDPGSTSTLDSEFGVGLFAGTYYIEIGTFPGGGTIPGGGDYELQISLVPDPVDTDSGGDDILIGGAGGDFLSGGNGIDTADYSTALSAVRADMMGLVAGLGDGAGDSFDSIEIIQGSDFNDRFYGDADGNEMFGGLGNDALFGRNGDDVLHGDDGNDFLIGGGGNDEQHGGAGNDQLHGNTGDDMLFGGDGDDFLTGGAGADAFDGGAGTDRVQYTGGTNAGVIASLLDDSINAGDAAGDTYVDIENLYGTAFDDQLHGDNGDNRIDGLRGDDFLVGWGGDDFMIGGGGDDILVGGDGNDKLVGQGGADQFWFSSGHGDDQIIGFEDGIDLIQYNGGVTDFADLTITQVGAHVLISSAAGTISVLNAIAADFTEDDFILGVSAQEAIDLSAVDILV